MKVSELHEKRAQEAETGRSEKLQLDGLEDTKILYYGSHKMLAFTAKIVRVVGDCVILDQSGFYPTSGGQLHDIGKLNGKNVVDAFKQGGVIVHVLEKGHGLKEGQDVKGEINPSRRIKLSQQHTATHIINAAARKVLGNHVNQSGAKKTEEKSHLDITHYQPLTAEEVKMMEELANKTVSNGIDVEKLLIPRNEAEKRFGMRIYQGGAVPGKLLRIVNIGGVDVEACGGTHVDNTKEVGRIKILKTTKIQDGIDRIEFTAGEEAGKIYEMETDIFEEVIGNLNKVVDFKRGKDVSKQLRDCAEFFSVPVDHADKTVGKFAGEILEYSERLRRPVKRKIAGSLKEACEITFNLWKMLKKEMETASKEKADSAAENLAKKAEGNEIFEIVDMERKDMISLCDSVLLKYPELTVILVNRNGDVIGMSETKDITKKVKALCEKYGGAGGGKGRLAQGKLDIKKLKIAGKN